MRDKKGKFIEGHSVPMKWKEISSENSKKRIAWNKGLTKVNSKKVKKIALNHSKTKKKCIKMEN